MKLSSTDFFCSCVASSVTPSTNVPPEMSVVSRSMDLSEPSKRSSRSVLVMLSQT